MRIEHSHRSRLSELPRNHTTALIGNHCYDSHFFFLVLRVRSAVQLKPGHARDSPIRFFVATLILQEVCTGGMTVIHLS